jgi:hypothetical protein
MAILDYIGSIGRILKGLSPSKNLTFFTNEYSQWLVTRRSKCGWLCEKGGTIHAWDYSIGGCGFSISPGIVLCWSAGDYGRASRSCLCAEGVKPISLNGGGWFGIDLVYCWGLSDSLGGVSHRSDLATSSLSSFLISAISSSRESIAII